jgi:hypothetical protein
MREALPVFGQKIKGFDMHDAVMTGVETRTSSPLRIAREDDSLQSPTLFGLYPAGEGAGYAGGIVSASVDGMAVGTKVVAAIAKDPFCDSASKQLPVDAVVSATGAATNATVKDGKILNPVTNRWVSVTGPVGRRLLAAGRG